MQYLFAWTRNRNERCSKIKLLKVHIWEAISIEGKVGCGRHSVIISDFPLLVKTGRYTGPFKENVGKRFKTIERQECGRILLLCQSNGIVT